MPTVAPEPAPPPGPRETHQAREVAESFGTDPGRYDRARPGYPDALVKRIIAAISGLSGPGGPRGPGGPGVLDVGCGTGIAARQFQAAGAAVLGVEPDPRMAAFARRSGVETEVATFEEWEPAGREFGAVIAATAWHWVDPVAGAAKAAGVLRPGGLLAVFWNAFEPPAGLREAFDAVYRRVLRDSPFFRSAMPGIDQYARAMCAKAADGVRQAGGFGGTGQWRFDWERPVTRDEWLDHVPTSGGHSRLSPGRQQELLAGIGEAVDAAGGSFTMRYATVAVTAVRSGAG
ncbi:MAG TPA: class I SAM-dependent methyltransferase [Streptosporangiaceae bacterium]|nr:class I SAM-dependent methyltransferase [Streptosporangiaceae bacterium]